MTGIRLLDSLISILLLCSWMLAITSIEVSAWTTPSNHNRAVPRSVFSRSTSLSSENSLARKLVVYARGGNRDREDEYYDDDGDDWDKVKVPRRGGGRRRRVDEDTYYYDDIASVAEDVTSGRTRREDRSDRNAYYNEGYYDEDESDDDDFLYTEIDDEDRELLSDALIPNPLLDSIDPDGAAERFPEIASDPRFWFDVVLFIAFLNFLSWAAPRDPYPDLPIDIW